MNKQNVVPWIWDPFTVRTKGPSLYYVSKRTRWVGSENDNVCWCSVLYLCWHSGWVKKVQKYADVIQGWSLINYCESRTFLSNLLAKSWQLFLLIILPTLYDLTVFFLFDLEGRRPNIWRRSALHCAALHRANKTYIYLLHKHTYDLCNIKLTKNVILHRRFAYPVHKKWQP